MTDTTRVGTPNPAVDAAYGKKSFTSEAERVAFLFERYQAITSLLSAVTVKKSGKSRPRQPARDRGLRYGVNENRVLAA